MKPKEKFVPFTEIHGDIKSGIVLICDHASNNLPSEYGSLGLEHKEFERHIAYDIGAADVTRAVAKRLNAPAVLSNFSRLLIDPNRDKNDPTLIMQLSDGSIIPHNYPITEKEKEKRIRDFYKPYDDAIGRLIERAAQQNGQSPMVVSIHSFTPVWRGKSRPWHIGLLWDNDRRIFDPLFKDLSKISNIVVGNNQPYDGALKGDTMYRHCTKNGIAHILIEVRQDLITREEGVNKWADYLLSPIEKINRLPGIHKRQLTCSRCDGYPDKID